MTNMIGRCAFRNFLPKERSVLDKAFPKAVKVIKKFLVPFTPNGFLRELQLKDTLIQTYPTETFDLLKVIFTPQYRKTNCYFLCEIMKLLSAKTPALKKDPEFIKIKDFLLQKVSISI